MDTGTGAKRAPNRVLFELRKERGWGRPRLASELDRFCQLKNWPSPGTANLEKQIYRLESGKVREPDDFYVRLFSEFFNRSALDLFGSLEVKESVESNFSIRSHKFIPVFIGPEAVGRLFADRSTSHPKSDQWTDCKSIPLGHDRLFGWPTGVVVLHKVERLRPTSIADVAVWRRSSYDPDMASLCGELSALGAATKGDPYVLSTYWVDSLPHSGPARDTALRLLCMPRVLTHRDDTHATVDPVASASVIEQALMRDGFDHSAIVDFSIKGVSEAFASWSGVVYAASSPERALEESALVACELSVQAAWAYCDFIRVEIEAGRDPKVPPEFNWRYLRSIRSRLTAERPQETSQERLMREAIVRTSGLDRRLTMAIEALRD